MRLLILATVLVSGVSAQYENGDVRLVGSSKPNEGKVEVFYEGRFGTVCDDSWDIRDAQVVCTQLGFPSAREAVSGNTAYTDNWNLEIFLDEVQCTGTEKKITDCGNRGIGVNNCFHIEDASVICNTEIASPTFEFISTGLPWVGRLQVSWNDVGIDQVGGICVTDMNEIDASVACKQLGFVDGAYPYSELLANLPEDMLVVFSEITCDGTETSLVDCGYSSVIKPTCEAGAVAGLVCVPDIVDPTIRLVDGITPRDGRIEAVWTISGFEQTAGICGADFTLTEAKVACKQLGFFDAFSVIGLPNPQPTTPYLLFEGIACSGTETELSQCTYTSLYNKNCPTVDYANVVCVEDVIAPTIRLVGGADPTEGFLEVAWTVDGTELTAGVCSSDITLAEAKVACKQLGFFDAAEVTAMANPAIPYALFQGITCTGTETEITQCAYTFLYNRNCQTNQFAKIICMEEPLTTYQDGDVRLAGPLVPVEGKVEVYYDGRWGTVCDDNWDILDAQVVCNQLGFPSAARALLGNNDYTDNWNLEIMLDEVQCTGTESRISECPSNGFFNHNCFHIEDASVICRETITNPVVGLQATDPAWTGPVKVTWNEVGVDQMAGICWTDFDITDGRVVCQQLGYIDVQSIYEVAMTTPMMTVLGGLQCAGTETDLLACPYTKIVNTNCETQTIAAVECIPDFGVPSVRLVGGFQPWSGKVELFSEVSGVETTAGICFSGLDIEDAAVICSQLGYLGVQSVFGAEDPTVTTLFFEGLDCLGTETDISSCPYTSFINRNCPSNLIATVVCIKEDPVAGDLRLVGGESTAEGRVEVFFSGQWGTVCDDSYDIYDAQVICHQLGFPSAQRAITGDLFGRSPYGNADPAQNIWLDDLRCFGNETKLMTCPSSGIGTSNCFHNEDVAVICNTGLTSSTVRLVGGSAPWEGRVEILWVHQGMEQYGTICDDKWTIEEARVVCRQLGYFDAKAAYGQAFFGEGAGMILLDDVACAGTETDIVQCAHSYWMNTDCLSSEDAGVVCVPDEPLYKTGKIRLAGGGGESEGRVEMFYEEWGVVCDDGWDIYDALVVCHELGFQSAREATIGSFFGKNTMEYWLSSVTCDGSETNLDLCQNLGVGVHNCETGMETAGVICNTDDFRIKVKLTDGPTPHEGMLTIRYGKTFGPVCDDSFDLKAADVVCRELGFFRAEKVVLNAPYGIPTAPFLLDDIVCTGTETSLARCARNEWFVHDCEPEEAVGVKCIPVDEGHEMWDIRLVNGTTPAEGGIEIYMDRMWTSLCASFTLKEAQVMCRQLGFPSAQIVTEPGTFAHTAEDIIKMALTCIGNENNLAFCNTTAMEMLTECDIEPVGVICNTGPAEVPIRLVNGGIPSAGRLEVFYNGEYGTVCDDYFGMENAKVACRQLGYAGVKMLAPEAHFGEGTGPIMLDNVRCIGTEENLAQCSHKEWTVHDCNHREDVGMMCYKDFESINIELTGDFVRENEGIAVVTANNSPGYICGDSFDKKDADVICRTMGYDSAIMALNKTLASSSTILSNLACTGKETSILDCDHSEWFDKTCLSGSVAYVSCKLPKDGDIRLADGATSLQGRLEIYYNNKWGLVCDDEFGMEDATVACLELGLGSPVEYKSWPFGSVPFNVPIWLDNLGCTYEDVKISSCQRNEYGIHDCTSVENVGIVCGEVAPVTPQLLDGPFNSLGTIEITVDTGARFQICSPLFTLANGMVLCSQMGYRGAAQVFQGNYFGTTRGQTITMNFNCIGDERTIAACPGFAVNPQRVCPVKEATSLVCLENEPLPIRLTGGPSPAEGRVEIKYGSKYGTICDDGFTIESATVICQSIGYLRAESFRSSGFVSELDVDIPIWLDNVVCQGTEPTIEVCLHNGFSTSNCGHEEDIIVKCTNEVPEGPDAGAIPEGTLRMVNTTSMGDGMYMAGRLEVYFGSWGTICDDDFDIADATAACKQLGFDRALTVFQGAAFGAGEGEIWIDNIFCPADSISLSTCTYVLGRNRCTHQQDVAVACAMNDFEIPIRLVGGEWPMGEGRVEIEINGVWGTICSEGWDLADADVVCKTMGYPGAAGRVIAGNFGEGTGPIHMSNVACSFSDTKLSLCPNDGFGVTTCDHTRDAGVVCRTERSTTVAFADRISPFEGRINLDVSGMSRSVCFEDFGMHEADVICRDLGFARSGLIVSTPARNGVPIKGTKVRCSGLETTIGDCRMEFLNTIDCQDELVAMVACLPWQEGDIRLANSHMLIEGRVEYFNDGQWGTICDDKWDIQDANVVCRQLGFSKAKRAMTQASFGEGTGPIWLDDVSCEGLERTIDNCQQKEIGTHNCLHSEDASVVCEMDVRLVGGRDATEGRVEIKYQGQWGTVCADGFDMLAANVVCRQIGFTSAFDVKLFQPGRGQIVLDEVACTGTETQLALCAHNGFTRTDCSHTLDIGVKCQ